MLHEGTKHPEAEKCADVEKCIGRWALLDKRVDQATKLREVTLKFALYAERKIVKGRHGRIVQD